MVRNWIEFEIFILDCLENIPVYEWQRNSTIVVEVAKKCIALHEQHASLLIELAKKRVQTGSPIVRPMWYAAPDDSKAYKVADQFMVGDNLVVAPVLVYGQRERAVYLPSGTWIDQHGKSYDGPVEIARVPAPLEELLYFKRKI